MVVKFSPLRNFTEVSWTGPLSRRRHQNDFLGQVKLRGIKLDNHGKSVLQLPKNTKRIIDEFKAIGKVHPIVTKGSPFEIWVVGKKALPKFGADMTMGRQQILGNI